MDDNARRHNLQRPVDRDYLEEWARHLRQPQVEAAVLDQSALVFRIGAEWLMLPTSLVDSIAPHAPSHALPHRRGGGLAGIVNVGGAILPAVSFETLLGIDGAAGHGTALDRHVFARLVVVSIDNQRFAVPVADLHGIVRYGAHQVRAPAATISRGLQRYLAGVLEHQNMMIGLLEIGLVGQQMAGLLR